MKKLWQYGCSVSLGEEATRPYGLLVSEYLNYEFIILLDFTNLA